MSAVVEALGNNRDAGVVEDICSYLTEVPPRSFFLFAGAGSGKTRTLVEVLRRMTGVVSHKLGGTVARQLRMHGRSIRVVTYTKNAVAVIKGRLGDNDLVCVSTIHAFCWELINGFNDDIRTALIALKQAQYDEEKAEAAKKPKGISAAKQRDLDEIQADIESLQVTDVFRYSPDREIFGSGALAHTQVLGAAAWLLKNRPTLQTILKDNYPIVLIDESQDTMKRMLDALMQLAEPRGSGLTLGLLGDHRQRIYADGHADLPALVPKSWATPELKMNHRSQRRIVTLINDIWSANLEGRTQAANGIQQHPREEKTGGFVRLYIGDTASSSEKKANREVWCAGQMGQVSQLTSWSEGDYQMLALEHKLVAARGCFVEAYNAMVLLDPNAAAPSGSGDNKGPGVVQILLNELAELETCLNADDGIDEFRATEVLRRHQRLDEMPQDSAARCLRINEMLVAMQNFAKACSHPNATVREVLEPVIDGHLFLVDPRLIKAFADGSPEPAPPERGVEEPKQDRMRRGWCALFRSPWSQLQKYRTYLSGGSALATHQVVKGSEFPHVMVVMDDDSAGGFLFSYDKIFGGTKLGSTDIKNLATGKETSIDRTLRLLYVTCSRAEESLALVLWSSNPQAALLCIRASGWFSKDEICLIQ
jgi:DNA helicase-2/ATP-dependent DNA helicase PcrA